MNSLLLLQCDFLSYFFYYMSKFSSHRISPFIAFILISQTSSLFIIALDKQRERNRLKGVSLYPESQEQRSSRDFLFSSINGISFRGMIQMVTTTSKRRG